MKVLVEVRFRDGVLDPEAEALTKSLHGLGYDQVQGVVQKRTFELDLDQTDLDAALEQAREMADRLLANPVIETFQVRPAE